LKSIGWYCTCENYKCEAEYFYWNFEDCIKIKNPEVKDKCLLSDRFLDRGIDVCNELIENKSGGDCYFRNRLKATSENCNEISDKSYKVWCLAVANRDSLKCNELNEDSKVCYRDVAIAMGNSVICDNINSSFDRQNCYDYVVREIHILSICNITDNYKRELCIRKVKENLAIETGDASKCGDRSLCLSEFVYFFSEFFYLYLTSPVNSK